MALAAGNGANRAYDGSSSIAALGTFSLQPASGDEALIELIITQGDARLVAFSATGSYNIANLTGGIPHVLSHRVTNTEYLKLVDTSGAANVIFYRGIQMSSTTTPANLSLGVINKTGSAIASDKLVSISGFDVTSGKPKIVLADADVAAYEDLYVVTASIDNDAEGTVYKQALSAATLNTNSATSAGDPVYLSTTAGAFAHTAPTTAISRVHPIGFVVVKSATIGQIQWLVGPVRKIGVNELQTDALAVHAIPFSLVQQPTGIPLIATETAGAHNIAVASDAMILEGEVTDNETEASISYFQATLPPDYVADGGVKIRVVAKRNGGEDAGVASTIDISAYEEGADGTVGADLCTTAAAALTASYVTTDFVITDTTLAPGDVLVVKLTTSVVDDAGGTTAKANIARLALLCDIRS